MQVGQFDGEPIDVWALRNFSDMEDDPVKRSTWMWSNRRVLSHLPFFRILVKRVRAARKKARSK